MTKFLSFLYHRLTIGKFFTAIATILFAIVLRQLFYYVFDIVPILGKVQVTDISFFAIINFFRLISNVFFEYLLNDKFETPLIQALGCDKSTALKMDSTSNTYSSSQGSSNATKTPTRDYTKEPLTEPERDRVRQMINNRAQVDPSFKEKLAEIERFHDDMYAHSDKMGVVLNDQTSKILKLHSIASKNDIQYIQENGGLQLSVPNSMTDDVAEKLSREVGALDRALQNKFSEYNNLSRKDARLYNSNGSSIYNEIHLNNIKLYDDLFKSANKKK